VSIAPKKNSGTVAEVSREKCNARRFSMPDVFLTQNSAMSLLLKTSVNNNPLSTGTGFVVQSGRGPVLVTNLHVVTGRNQQTGQPISPTGGLPDEITIVHNVQNQLGQWKPVKEPLYEAGQPRWKEHPTHGPKVDIAALPLTNLDQVQLYPYDVVNPGPDIAVGPADVVSVIGFPFGLAAGGALAIWATGFVASEPAVEYNGLPIFLIDCRSREGQSGSPVIAYRNGGAVPRSGGGTSIFSGPFFRLLGIYSGRINAQSDIGIVWKTSAIQVLVASI
jgi:Trypsin-like peptidase domain